MEKRQCHILKPFYTIAIIAMLCISVFGAELKVGGQTVGIKVKLRGLLVTSVEADSAAESGGLRPGDSLLSLDGVPLDNVQQLTSQIESGNLLVLNVLRNGESRTLFIQPQQSDNGYKLGAAVRDDLAGIGTVTYFDPETRSFGALGHGICDLNGSALLEIDGGVIVPSRIIKVDKSIRGTAGQLQGEFETEKVIGLIDTNTSNGVFGQLDEMESKLFSTAAPNEITNGAVTIRANINGTEVREYSAEIVSKLPGAAHSGKDLLIHITDPELLDITGGIVQGMSGSPIIQNGKLIGAITHVLINAPEYGYAVYIDRMLEAGKRSASSTSSFFLFDSTKDYFICRILSTKTCRKFNILD